MRELKFRAWEKPEKRMMYGEKEWFDDMVGWRFNHFEIEAEENPEKEIIIMQYTGLKDKNGKEIYESDYLDDWCVFWGSGKYILQNISTGDIIDCNEKNTLNKEVDGNRFENLREHKAMATDL